jgi:hypothetical protein
MVPAEHCDCDIGETSAVAVGAPGGASAALATETAPNIHSANTMLAAIRFRLIPTSFSFNAPTALEPLGGVRDQDVWSNPAAPYWTAMDLLTGLNICMSPASVAMRPSLSCPMWISTTQHLRATQLQEVSWSSPLRPTREEWLSCRAAFEQAQVHARCRVATSSVFGVSVELTGLSNAAALPT